MKKVRFILLVMVVGLLMTSCAWPKVFVKTSSGWVTYDRLNHRLEVVWDFTTQTPEVSTFKDSLVNVGDTIVK